MARLGRDPEIPADLPGWWTGLLVAMTRRDPERRLSAEVVQQVLEGRHPPPPLDPEEWAARTRPATWAQDTPDGAQPGSGPFPAPVTPPPPTPPPATPPPPAPPAADARWPGGPGVADPAPRRSRGRLLAAVGSAALVVVLLVVGLWWGVFRSSPDEIVTGSRPVDMAARDVYDILVAADTLNATTDLELERRLFTLYDEAAHAIVASRWEDALAALVEMVEVSQQAVDSNAVDPVFLRRLGPALEQLRAEISAARQVEVGGD